MKHCGRWKITREGVGGYLRLSIISSKGKQGYISFWPRVRGHLGLEILETDAPTWTRVRLALDDKNSLLVFSG